MKVAYLNITINIILKSIAENFRNIENQLPDLGLYFKFLFEGIFNKN